MPVDRGNSQIADIGCQSVKKAHDLVGMDRPTPPLPPRFHPLALVFEPHELIAICDAILVHDLMVDGCLSDALALTNSVPTPEDPHGDGGYNRSTVRVLADVREKIDKAQEHDRKAVRRWMDERKAWEEENDSPS